MISFGPLGSPAALTGPGSLDYGPILDAIPDAVLIHDGHSGRILAVNQAFLDMFGHARDALAGLDVADLSSPEATYSSQEAQRRIAQARALGRAEFPWRSRRADGSLFWSEVRLTDGGEGRVVALVRDITARVQAEEALAWAEEKYEKLFRANPASILVARFPEGTVLEANETLLRMTGYAREELIGQPAQSLWVDPGAREAYAAQVAAQGRVAGLEAQFRVKDGSFKIGRLSGELLDLPSGRCMMTLIEDITGFKASEAALIRLSRLYSALSLVNQSLVRVTTEAELFTAICEDLVRGGGFWAVWIAAPEAASGLFQPLAISGGHDGWVEGLQVYATGDRPEGWGTMGRAYRQGEPIIANDFDASPITAPWRDDGRWRGFKAAASFPLRRGDGRVFGVMCLYARETGYFGPQEIALLEEVCQDITFALEGLAREERRRRAEAEQTHLRDLLQAIIDSTPDLIYAKDPGRAYLLVNRPMAAFLDRPPEAIIGHHDADFWPEASEARPAWKLRAREEEDRALAGDLVSGEVSMEPPGGGEPRVFDAVRAPLRGPDGRIEGVLGVARDITELRRQQRQRQALEARLQQSQKLESLGNLAGGVAHDLNNVLGAILGQASLELDRGEPAAPSRRAMEAIVEACVRGREVVQSLLMFARRDLGEERAVDLNRTVREIVGLLSHTTLQRITFATDLDPGLRCVRGDPSALNHALMNVCVNAVDAMPEGGTLTLRTRNGEDGSVSVWVEDTGQGMPEEVALRATEPFFTTKPPGKGTGLGLSMVYGTLQAHRGSLGIASKPGQGTQVHLMLPGVGDRPEVAAPAQSLPRAAGLRILVVDDDDMLRESVRDVLAWQGHDAVGVTRAQAALDLLATGERFDLVILDLNMPGMTGHEALPRILELRPDQRILVSSGFTDPAFKEALARMPTVRTIGKPFTTQELARKLQEF